MDVVAKKRYKEKLEMLGLDMESDDDPLALSKSKFTTSPDGWPVIEVGQIIKYFIDTPAAHTDTTQLAHRSLEADNFVKDGFVQTVEHRRTSTGAHILRAGVMRSQTTTKPPHHAWVAVRDNGEVLSAHCTCMAG